MEGLSFKDIAEKWEVNEEFLRYYVRMYRLYHHPRLPENHVSSEIFKKQFKERGMETATLTKHNVPIAVVLSLDDYFKLLDELEKLRGDGVPVTGGLFKQQGED